MDNRRDFLKKSILLSGAAGIAKFAPASVQRAFSIDPQPGSTFWDAEHVVILMQENRSFDHCFGSLQGVRGFNDPRAITLPDKQPVWAQKNEQGEAYPPFRLDIRDTKVTWMGDLPHTRASQVDAYNAGKHDQWLTSKVSRHKQYAQMPLTMGYYNRQDLPFNYAMADAFTVCDQNFCSAMTSTTPNRSFFWTGKITDPVDGRSKAHIRNDDYSFAKLPWTTFPELLEENDILWKFYQNELDCGGGFKGEERAWLSNFGCNNLEFFAAYNVKFAPHYVENLLLQVQTLPGEIEKLQEATPSSDEEAQKTKAALAKKQEVLDNATAELKKWSKDSFAKLSDKQKRLYNNAFVVNTGDPSYRQVTSLSYNNGTTKREVMVPAGDVLHQFRQDVKEGKLPAVSWLAGPQNFSDHPSAPMYGAWYISEVLDILTQNPEVWKKTIFIVTYDENDGYFDHVPPFSIPDDNLPGTGKVSPGIDTEIEHVRMVNELAQGIPQKQAREAPVGLGFRVPMIIASPWSRGGKVCSQLFEHTSTLQFLETFLNKKYNKNIRVDNISQWRRAISGNLTAAFSPFDGKKLEPIPFLNRDQYVENIYSAQFKPEPSGYKKLSDQQIAALVKDPHAQGVLDEQEKGVRPACALPYELYADGKFDAAKKEFGITMAAGNKFFGKAAIGSPFTVCAPGAYTDHRASIRDAGTDQSASLASTNRSASPDRPGQAPTEISRNWSFAVRAGDALTYSWPADAFANGRYHLRLAAPNGFYREFAGDSNDPALAISCQYERDPLTRRPTGNLVINITPDTIAGSQTASVAQPPSELILTDNAYKKSPMTKQLTKGKEASIVLNLTSSHGWYDFSIRLKDSDHFERRYAGRVETGKESITDPFMGRVV
ncbi:MAG TPA: phospholipase C, phosphocholine-specific [Puia sp.]|nr:phospholipase C, phosphocholine-specific [Puia sp.]